MFMRKLKRALYLRPAYWIAIVILAALIVLSVSAPLFSIDPNATDVTNMMQPPSGAHWFGTDELGRDYFIRVLYGGRVSLYVGVISMLATTLIGLIIGLISGYFGGWVDTLLMRLVDILSSIPWLVLVIVLSVFMKPGLTTIIIVIGGFSWMSLARLVRAETLALKERDYVVYAQFIGINPVKIMIQHILPGVVPTMLVASTASIAGAIMTESSLSFLGVGLQPPHASWGSLLQNAQSSLQRAPHMALIPGLLIMLTVYGFNQLGHLLRDTYEMEDLHE
ncbi:ABC transporter permease [Falseniella ignava]|uniref:ABC transmembrane type-1 domain-containing protein n=1 Tax=Falseniella ignava CCUG 37419 TaxID=883112 RepID=K1LGK3_9LACT|nr:hypothetical protein HMPREF9707_00937 [Falseniella ignava CCUG 37419]